MLLGPTILVLGSVFRILTSLSNFGRASLLVTLAVLIAAALSSVPAYYVLDKDVEPLLAGFVSALGASIGAIVGSLAGVSIDNRVRKPD